MTPTHRLRSDWPFPAARVPVFYGWVIAALSTLGFLMSIPGQTMGMAVFTDPLIEALSLSRTQLSMAYDDVLDGGYGSPNGGKESFTGYIYAGVFLRLEVSLHPSQATSQVVIRFEFSSDRSLVAPGWYLDEFKIGESTVRKICRDHGISFRLSPREKKMSC